MPFEIANSIQVAVELPTARHAASIAPLPSTAMAPLSRPWDASAVLSLLSGRKPAVKFASAIRWTGRSAPRSRLLTSFFALRWIPAAAVAPSRRTRLRRTAFACARALAKASNLPRSYLRFPAQGLVAPRTSPPKSLPSRANAPSLAARRGNLPRSLPRMTRSQSKKPQQRTTAPVHAALTTSLSRLHPSRTTVPNRATPSTSLPSRLLVDVQDLVAEQPRLRLSKRPLITLALVLAASHQSRISSRLQRLVVRTLAARKSDRSALRALAPMPAAPLLRLITGWRLRRPQFRL